MSVNFDEFDTLTREAWIAKANLDLKGKKDANGLVYNVEEGLQISAFQTSDPSHVYAPIVGPQTKSGVMISSSPESNGIAKKLLENGVEALSFVIEKDTDFDILFEGIYLDMITVVLVCTNDDIDLSELDAYLSKNYADKNVDIILKNNKNQIKHKSIVVTLDHNDSFKTRIANASSTIKKVVSSGNYKNSVIDVSLKRDLLAQIAELRAIRMIWSQILESQNMPFTPLSIITNTDILLGNVDDVHPLIQVNYLLMSAYFGMSDVAFGLPYADDPEMSRLCLNIHHIFREESLLDRVSDPTCGSYVVEALTRKMIKIGL